MLVRILFLLLTLGIAPVFQEAQAIQCTNEPAGFTTVFETQFNNLSGLNDVYRSTLIVPDSTAPSSPDNVAMHWINPGQTQGGGELHWVNYGLHARSMYTCKWYKVNAEWQGRTAQDKLFFVRGHTPSGALDTNGLFEWVGGPKKGGPMLLIWAHNSDVFNNHLGGCDGAEGGNCYPNSGLIGITPGQWVRIETVTTVSTTKTSRDGAVQWWVYNSAGSLLHSGNYSGVNYGTVGGGLNNWVFTETWDGSGDMGVSNTNRWEHKFDELKLSVGNCGSSGCGGTYIPPVEEEPTTTPPPGTVNDLSSSPLSITSVNVQFTTVSNADSYDIRYAPGAISWGAAQSVSVGTCRVPYAPGTAGLPTACSITGLLPDTTYQIQVVGQKGTTSGLLSNVATVKTSASPTGGGGGGSSTPTVTVYSYVDQFSGVQGQSGWNYQTVGGTLFPSFSGGLWSGPDLYQGAWNNGFHPGPSSGAVVRFTVPSDGEAAVAGGVKLYSSCSGGVSFEARLNGVAQFTKTIGASDTTEYPYSFSSSVSAGDQFDFVVFPGGAGNTCDSTQLNPTITMTVGGGGGVAAPTLTGFTPVSGLVGSTVVITGTNFGSTPSSNIVLFNGVTATVTAATPTELTVTVPASATSGTVSVETAGGTATSVSSFTVSTSIIQPAPTDLSLLSTDTYRVIVRDVVWDLRGSGAPFVLYKDGSCGTCDIIGYSLVYSTVLDTVGIEFIPGRFMYWDTALSEWVIISGAVPYTPPIQVVGTFTFSGVASAGFNVYRSDAAGGVKTKLPILLTATDRTFTDAQHSFGCFEVASYGQNGEEGPHSTEKCTLHGQGLSREIGLLNPKLLVDFQGRVWELRGATEPFNPYVDGICLCTVVGYTLRYQDGGAQVEFLPGKWMRYDDTLEDWVIVSE